MHITYEEQVKGKKKIFDKLFERAGIEKDIIKDYMTSPQYNFRYSSNYKAYIKDKQCFFGYNKKKSNDIIDIYECHMLTQGFNDLAASVREVLNVLAKKIVYADFHIRMIKDFDTDRFMLRIDIIDSDSLNDVSKICTAFHDLKKDIDELVYVAIHDDKTQGLSQTGLKQVFSYTYDGLSHFYDTNSFVQSNLGLNKKLVEHVVRHAKGHKSCLELYAGNGNFTFSLSRACEQVTAIELSRNGIFCAQEGIKSNNITNVKVFKQESLIFARQAQKNRYRYDVVVLDPPRTGCKPVVEHVVALGAKKIVYVSCSIRTLVRDIEVFKAKGYDVQEIMYFDMFPNTAKIETVCILKRSD